MIQLLNKLDKDTLIALCVALFSVHQPHNGKKVVRSILEDIEEEKTVRNQKSEGSSQQSVKQ